MQTKVLKCLKCPEEEDEKKLNLTILTKTTAECNNVYHDKDPVPTKDGKFKSKSILVKNALRFGKKHTSSEEEFEENIDHLSAWEQLKIFQRSISDQDQMKEAPKTEISMKRKNLTRQTGMDGEEETETTKTESVQTIGMDHCNKTLGSTDSDFVNEPRKRIKKKKRRSQKRKWETRISQSSSLPDSLPPPYNEPPPYNTLPRQVS